MYCSASVLLLLAETINFPLINSSLFSQSLSPTTLLRLGLPGRPELVRRRGASGILSGTVLADKLRIGRLGHGGRLLRTRHQHVSVNASYEDACADEDAVGKQKC